MLMQPQKKQHLLTGNLVDGIILIDFGKDLLVKKVSILLLI